MRLPDAAVLPAGPLPDKMLTEPPTIAMEVLSDSDSYIDLKERAQDFHKMGVPHIWLLDPKNKTADRWIQGSWRPVPETRLYAGDSPIYLDLEWLWSELNPQD